MVQVPTVEVGVWALVDDEEVAMVVGLAAVVRARGTLRIRRMSQPSDTWFAVGACIALGTDLHVVLVSAALLSRH